MVYNVKHDRTNADLRRALPEFTYHLTVMWTDGEVSAIECGIDRDGAFDFAAEAHGDGCGVEIIEVERNPETGGPIGVSDITATFFTERGLDPDRLVTCEDCGHKGRCTCDDAYDEWRAEQ